MADTKISALTDGSSAQSGDLIPVARSGANYYITPSYIGTTLLGSTVLSGATVTTSQPVLNLSQTWNAGAVTFTGLKFNATDTASGANSLLLDLQIGGSSIFKVSKTGSATTTGYYYAYGFSGTLASITTYDIGGFSDTYLTRAAAATLRLGQADAAAPVAQTLQVQSVVAGTSNTAGANWTLKGSAGTGTGAGGSIIFQVAPAGTTGTAQNAYTTALTIASSGAITTVGNLTLGGIMAVVFNGGYYINGRGSLSAPADGNWMFVNNAGTSFGLLQLGGSTSSFPALKRSSAALVVRLADDTADAALSGASLLATGTGGVGYATGAGGAVTQITSRTTGVTLNKTCGAITLFTTTAVVGTWFSFTLTNSAIAATDTVQVSVKSGTNTYVALVSAVAAGSCQISCQSIAGTASDAPVINFAVVKAVTA